MFDLLNPVQGIILASIGVFGLIGAVFAGKAGSNLGAFAGSIVLIVGAYGFASVIIQILSVQV